MAEEGSFVDAALVDQVAAVDGVDRAVPQVSGYGALIGTDGEAVGGNGPPRLAGNWVDDPDLNPYRLVDGRAPEADDEVVVNRGALDASGYHLGDRLTVQMPAARRGHGRRRLRRSATQEGLGDVTFTAFTLDAAERYIAGGTGRVTSVLVKADARRVAGRARRPGSHDVVPGDVEVRTGAQVTEEQAQRHRGRLPRDDDHVPHGLRRDRPAGGDVQHLQHVLDPRGPADPGDGAAPGRRAPPAARCW